MRTIGNLLANFERDDHTRIYDHKIRSVYKCGILALDVALHFDTLQQKPHPVVALFRVQTEQENVSMNYIGKLNGNIISSRKYLKRCLSVCLISVLQCPIHFLVPLSVAGYNVSRVLCFQFCKRTVPSVRVRQPMSTLFR